VEIGELLQNYMLNTVINFLFKNFIALGLNDKTISQVHATETVSLSFKCEINLKCEIS